MDQLLCFVSPASDKIFINDNDNGNNIVFTFKDTKFCSVVT